MSTYTRPIRGTHSAPVAGSAAPPLPARPCRPCRKTKNRAPRRRFRRRLKMHGNYPSGSLSPDRTRQRAPKSFPPKFRSEFGNKIRSTHHAQSRSRSRLSPQRLCKSDITDVLRNLPHDSDACHNCHPPTQFLIRVCPTCGDHFIVDDSKD